MPTKKQLSKRRASERLFGDSSDDGYNVRGSNMAGKGNDPFTKPFTGETIGAIQYNPETKDLRIIFDTSEESAKKDDAQ